MPLSIARGSFWESSNKGNPTTTKAPNPSAVLNMNSLRVIFTAKIYQKTLDIATLFDILPP